MKKFCFLSLIVIITFGCNTKNKVKDATSYIPENATLIFSINNLESLKSNIQNNHFINLFANSKIQQRVKNKLQTLKYLKTNNSVLLCFNLDAKDSLQYTIITKQIPNLFLLDSLPNVSVATYNYNRYNINKAKINNTFSYHTFKDSMFIASSSKEILEKTLIQDNTHKNLKQILSTTNKNKAFSVYINNQKQKFIKSVFLNDSILFANLSSYTLLDTEINQDEIIFNGISKALDSSKSIINIFKNTVAQKNSMASITPSNTDGFISYTFNNFSTFNENLKQYKQIDSLNTNTSLFENCTEIGEIFQSNNQAVVLKTLDVIATQDALLNEQDIAENYREISIYNFSQPKLFNQHFSPLITLNNATYYANLDHFFVFANSMETMQNIIANYQNGNTYKDSSYYEELQEELTNEASILIVANSNTLKNNLEKNLNEDLNISLNDYKTTAIQYIFDTHFAHVNGVVKKSKKPVRENSVNELYNIQLEADLLNLPQLVTNPITKQKEIVVQDVNNNLYLISNTGKILWKKQLEAPILGEINEIDSYKNGKLQMAFATTNRVYIIDRNGNEVAPFPLKFNDKITQPLSVFDYDNNKKYRLLVTQEKNVLLYDAKGKRVKGFTFKSAESPIIQSPQHLRINTKDYLILKTENKLYILDRKGKNRVTPKKQFHYSNQKTYHYNDKFTTTTRTGELVFINTNGETSSNNINLDQNHEIVTTSKTLVALSGNKLTIKNKTIELDFGNYDAPKLFYLNNKIYVSVTDKQAHKVYLYDSNAKLLPNFPVYGNSAIALDNLNKDANLEFVTKGENNAILIYQIN